MQVEFEQFVENPSAANYLRARDAIGARVQRRGSLQVAELAQLWLAGQLDAVRRRAKQMMPAWVLCARVHFYAADAAFQLGDEADGEVERFLWHRCLLGILATGEGNEASPYQITHCCDEYDVLQVLGLAAECQTLLRRDGAWFDVVRCRDGSEIWFDVSGIVEWPSRRAVDARGEILRVPS